MSQKKIEFQCIGKETAYYANFPSVREIVNVNGREQIEYRQIKGVKITDRPTPVTEEQAEQLRTHKYFGKKFIEVGSSAATRKAAQQVLTSEGATASGTQANGDGSTPSPTPTEPPAGAEILKASTKQEALEALHLADVTHELTMKNRIEEIVAVANEAGYAFDQLGN